MGAASSNGSTRERSDVADLEKQLAPRTEEREWYVQSKVFQEYLQASAGYSAMNAAHQLLHT